MFDAVRNNKRIVQIFLCLIALPFAFFGFDSLRNAGGNDIASVGEIKISMPEYEQALREQSDRARRVLGDQFDPALMESKEMRKGVLDSLIDKKLLALEVYNSKLMTSREALIDALKNNPAIQENGKISEEKYTRMLSAYGMSEAQYEATLRQELTMYQLVGTMTDSAFVSDAQTDAILRLQSEERQYSEFKIAANSFANKVNIDPSEIQKFYDENKALFEVPRQVKAQYLVFTPESLAAQITISEDEIKEAYESHKDRYDMTERRASHILISTRSDKKEARTKAEDVLKQVQASPEQFAELAKTHSQDPGSAANGGDLGFFGRGMMVKPFEDAVFKMKTGEISGLVESDFGFHIIKLTDIKAGKVRSLEEVRPEIVAQLRQQAAQRKFAEEAEVFRDSISQEFDSLTPTAERFKLKIQETDWLPRKPSAQQMAALGPIANEKVLTALFSSDAIEKRQNIDVIQTTANMLVAARVIDYKPAETKSFDAVKQAIEAQLKAKALAAMAQEAGEAQLAELKGGQDTLTWKNVGSVSRVSGQELSADVLRALFKVDVEKLPAYTAVSQADGDYTLYKITKVSVPEKFDEPVRKSIQSQYANIIAQEDWAAYLKALRAKYKIKINQEALEKTPQSEEAF